MGSKFVHFGAAMAGVMVSGLASASVTHFASNADALEGTPGVAFLGTSNWSFSGASGVLELSITNTTSPDIGGFLTGVAFNLGGASGNVELLSSSVPGFVGMKNVNAQPFGQSYAAGAAIGGNWTGGGRPQGGIAPGETGLFIFSIGGAGAASLSSGSFLTGPYEHDFVVRFRGLSDGGSSKVPAMVAQIPAPGGAALMVAALAVGASRRREKAS